MATTPAASSPPNLPLLEIIRRAISKTGTLSCSPGNLRLGPSSIDFSIVPKGTERDINVDRICSIEDVQAARVAIIGAVQNLKHLVLELTAAGNVLQLDDADLIADELREKYDKEESWGEHPLFSMEAWRSEVADESTRLGYWRWCENHVCIARDQAEGSGLVDEAMQEGAAGHRKLVGVARCKYCGRVDCDFDCDESQAGGFNGVPPAAPGEQVA